MSIGFWHACRERIVPLGTWLLVALAFTATNAASQAQPTQGTSAPRWLEDRTGDQALRWVDDQNRHTLSILRTHPTFSDNLRRAEQIAFSNDLSFRNISIHGDYVYRISVTDHNPRGLLQRLRLERLHGANGGWDTLLDIDELARQRNEPIVASIGQMQPGGTHFLLMLQGGEAGATRFEEFDPEARAFVRDGFRYGPGDLPFWAGRDRMLVARYGAPGTGFRLSLSERPPVASASTELYSRSDGNVTSVPNSLSRLEDYVLRGSGNALLARDAEGRFVPVPITSRTDLSYLDYLGGHVIFRAIDDFEIGSVHIGAGSVIAVAHGDMLNERPAVELLLDGSQFDTIRSGGRYADGMLLVGSKQLQGVAWSISRRNGRWDIWRLPIPPHGTTYADARLNSQDNRSGYLLFESFTQRPSLYEIDARHRRMTLVSAGSGGGAEGAYTTRQFFARSPDGTMVPYFVVRRSGGEARPAPTLLYAYGAYNSPNLPYYDDYLVRLWLDRGGVYVSANVRGGGEFGRGWHVTGEAREHVYEDFVAVAEDLVRRQITEPRKLGITGYSAGAALMAVEVNRRPDLFGAAVLRVGLYDFLRPDLTQAGRPGFDPEWGSIDVPAQRAYLERTSPTQNLRASVPMPALLVMSGRQDPRVHPAQSRLYAQRLLSLHHPALYYEDREGGHNFGNLPADRALIAAMMFTFLGLNLGMGIASN